MRTSISKHKVTQIQKFSKLKITSVDVAADFHGVVIVIVQIILEIPDVLKGVFRVKSKF